MAKKYWTRRSHTLLATRFGTTINSIAALWSETASVGNGFVPLSIENESQGKALVAWWNSTPTMLMLLNLRSKTFNYPKWSLAQLRSIKIPKPEHPAWVELTDVFERHKNTALLPLKQAEQCGVRKSIDKVAAKILDVSEDTIRDWRRLLSEEPTVTGNRQT